MPKQRSNLVLWAILGLIVLVALIIYVGRRHINRGFAIGAYGEAIGYCFVRNRPIPESILELEALYNSYDRRREQLPPPPWFIRPTFRPVRGLVGGPFLVLVEKKPSGINDWTCFVVYAKADGSAVEVKSVWGWELAEIMPKDDENRALNQIRRIAK